MTLREDDEISSRPASDFEDGVARLNVHLAQQLIAAE
jgi:hypothetical protein